MLIVLHYLQKVEEKITHTIQLLYDVVGVSDNKSPIPDNLL
jgi:acetolactate synthase small subunit